VGFELASERMQAASFTNWTLTPRSMTLDDLELL